MSNALEEALIQAMNSHTDPPAQPQYSTDEQEYVQFICKIIDEHLVSIDMKFDVEYLIQPQLRKYMWCQAVEAMDWTLRCAVEDMEFDSKIDAEIPILCRYYNNYIQKPNWTVEEDTIMQILSKYDQIKAEGHGNFGDRREHQGPP